MHFRLFISSTFEDMKTERDLLKRVVFPKVKSELGKLGHTFLPIDLRWGVSDESSLDHSTMDICLSEIRRAKESTQKPNFLILLGQRYGWIPLPNRLTSREYEALKAAMPDLDLALFQSQYVQDENALDGHYALKKRTGALADPVVWHETVEMPLQAAVWAAAKASGLPNGEKFFLSATEHEIELGALGKDSDGEQVVYFKRTLENVAEDQIKAYFNVDGSGAKDLEAEKRVQSLEERLDEKLGDQKIALAASLKDGEFDRAYQDAFCERIYQSLMDSMLSLIRETDDDLRSEINTHEKQARMIKAFQCQRAGEKAASFVKSGTGVALIQGGPGMGKTSLITKLFQDCPHAKIIRYAGLTSAASNRTSLIETLAREINRLADIPMDIGGSSPEKMLSTALAGLKSHLTVFIDDADRLESGGFSFVSILKNIPEKVSFVLTAQKHYDNCTVFDLSSPQAEEVKDFMESYLKQNDRTLSTQQYEVLFAAAKNCGSYAELSSLCAIACHWRREDEPDFARGISNIIMERLSSQYGESFAFTSLSLIARSRDGLTQDELNAVLSNDAGVMAEYQRMYPKSPQTDMIPDIILTRLLFDAAAHIKTSADESNEYIFMPSSLLKDDLRKTHGEFAAESLLDFWEKQEAWLDDGRRIPNRRMLREWPALLLEMRPGALEGLAGDYGICEAMAYAGLAAEYVQLAKGAKSERAQVLCKKTREMLHHLYRHPAVLYSSILCDKTLSEDFRRYVLEVSGREAYLELLDSQKTGQRLGLTQVAEAKGYAVDGLRLYIDAGDIYVYDLEQQRLEPDAIPPDSFPYHITPSHKLVPKAQDVDLSPPNLSINAQKASSGCEICGGRAEVEEDRIYFHKNGKRTPVALKTAKQIARPYNLQIYFSVFLISALVFGVGMDYRFENRYTSVIMSSGYLMAMGIALFALLIFYMIVAIKRRLGLFYIITPEGAYFIKSVLANNGRLFAFTSMGFVLSCTEKELNSGKPVMRYLNTITSPSFGEHVFAKFTENIEMCCDEHGNIILQSIYSKDQEAGKRLNNDRYLTVLSKNGYKKALTMSRGILLGGITTIEGDTCCLYQRKQGIPSNEVLYLFNLRTGQHRPLASGIPYTGSSDDIFEADVYHNASVAVVRAEKPFQQVIVIPIGDQPVKLSGLCKPDSAVSYLDDKIAVVASNNPSTIERVETANNHRKVIRLPFEEHYWLRNNNLIVAYNHEFQVLIDVRRMDICRVFRGKSWSMKGLGLPRFLAGSVFAVALSLAFPRFLPAFGWQYLMWASILCLLTRIGHWKYGAQGDKAFKQVVFSGDRQLVTDNAVYDYVRGETVSKRKVPRGLRIGEFFGSLFFYGMVIGLVETVMQIIPVFSDKKMVVYLFLSLLFIILAFTIIFLVIFIIAYGGLHFFTKADWHATMKQKHSETVTATVDGGSSYIKVYAPKGELMAETVSTATILEAYSSPSGTSAILLSADREALLLKVHSRIPVREVVTPPIQAKRRPSYILFRSFVFHFSVLLALCGAMAVSALIGWPLSVTAGFAALGFGWLVNLLIH